MHECLLFAREIKHQKTLLVTVF